jgi:DNA-binding CsgD family transcriptional regulator
MFKEPFDTSYNDYLSVDKTNFSPFLHTQAEEIREKKFGDIDMASPACPVLFFLDYTERKYNYIHKSVAALLGFSVDHFMRGGLEMYLNQLHETDFHIFNRKIFADNLKILAQYAPERASEFIFTHSLRIKNKKGDYQIIAQRHSFVLSPCGIPLGTIGYVFDLTPFKTDKKMVHMVEEKSKNGDHIVLLKKYYYPDEGENQISKRELEVLKWTGEGLSAKQVAGKMGLSFHTINNHRKNMMQKTHTQNSSELLSYAIRNGLL